MAIRDVIANFRLRDRSQQDVQSIQNTLSQAFTGFGFRSLLAGLGAEIAGAITQGFTEGIERVDELRQRIRHETGLPSDETDPIAAYLTQQGIPAESAAAGIFATRRFPNAYESQYEQAILAEDLARLDQGGVNLQDFSQFTRQFLGADASAAQISGVAEYGFAAANAQGLDPATLFRQASGSGAELQSIGLNAIEALEFTVDVDRTGIDLSSIRRGLGFASRQASEADVPFLDYLQFAQNQILAADENQVAGLGANFFGSQGNAGVRTAQAIRTGDVGFFNEQLYNPELLGSSGLDIIGPTRRERSQGYSDAARLQGGFSGAVANFAEGTRGIPIAGDIVDLIDLQTVNTDVSRGTTVGNNPYVVANFNITAGTEEISDEAKERILAVVRDEIQSGNIRIPRSY